MLIVDDVIKVRIAPSNHFTGCWFSPDINLKSGSCRYKAGRGNMLTTMFTATGYSKLVNYKVVDIVPREGFTITKECV